MELLFAHATVLGGAEGDGVLHDGYVGIEGGKITYVGTVPPPQTAARTIDATGKILMPGLVNTHTHVSMAPLRGYADDYPLQEWLHEHVFPVEGKMDRDCVYYSALLGIAEMIASGTVAMTDMYMHIPAVAKAAYEAGIYANISNGALSFSPDSYDFATDSATAQMEEMLRDWHGADEGRIVLDAAIHAEYTSFERLWRAQVDYAKRHGLRMHLHLSETHEEHAACIARYGKTPAQCFADAGVFGVPTTAAHCTYLSEDDMALLAKHGVSVAHNPVSNLKLASGIAPVPDMLRHGVNVALGTDGVCSNNNSDLFEELKLVATLHKGVRRDATAIRAHEALAMATRAGACAQGRQDAIGTIAPGYDASVILLDTNKPHLQPVHNPISSVVYAAGGGDVCLSMVRGKILYENGQFLTIDWEQLMHALTHSVMPRLFGA